MPSTHDYWRLRGRTEACAPWGQNAREYNQTAPATSGKERSHDCNHENKHLYARRRQARGAQCCSSLSDTRGRFASLGLEPGAHRPVGLRTTNYRHMRNTPCAPTLIDAPRGLDAWQSRDMLAKIIDEQPNADNGGALWHDKHA